MNLLFYLNSLANDYEILKILYYLVFMLIIKLDLSSLLSVYQYSLTSK